MKNYKMLTSGKGAILTSCLMIFNLLTINVFAQWSSNPYQNNPICTNTGTQAKPVIVTDGSGGAIITWLDDRGSSTIYAQRIDANGIVKWTSDGIVVCSAAYFRGYPSVISDGSGGAIITWPDYRNGIDFDIYAQRVNGDGLMQWATDGVGICLGQGDQNFPRLISDGSGGAIFTWIDDRTLNTMNPDIYAQGINSDGTLKWPQTIGISTNQDGVTSPALTTDGNGGAIITWMQDMSMHNDTSAADIYAQHLDKLGNTHWATDGVCVCAAKRMQLKEAITSDGNGGGIITWVDERNEDNTHPLNSDIYAQRINANGIVQWQTDGIGISTTFDQQGSVQIISDAAGGAIIAFLNWSGYVNTLITQRINNNGSKLWGGFSIGSGYKGAFDLVPDNGGGAMLSWEDSRSGAVDNYSQHLDASGTELWTLGGVLVSNAFGSQANPKLVNDNTGGVIIAWDDNRNTNLDIYAQHVQADGTLGGNVTGIASAAFNSTVSVYPNPAQDILSIRNQPGVFFEKVVITDLTGKKVREQTSNLTQIDVSQLNQGMYLLQITSEGKKSVSKFIKQ